MGSGGVMDEMTYETANSVVRPPSEVTKTPIAGDLRIDWQAPSFGVVSQYERLLPRGHDDPVRVGTVSGDPPQTTITVTSPVADAVYFVTTTVAADGESTTPRSSPPSDPAVLKNDQTIAFVTYPARWYGDRTFHGQRSGEPFGIWTVSFSAAGNVRSAAMS